MIDKRLIRVLKELSLTLLLRIPQGLFIYLALSFLAGYLGYLHYLFEYGAHFRVQQLAGGVVFALVFSGLRQWRWAAAAAAIALICMLHVAPMYYPRVQAAEGASYRGARLMLANVLYSNLNHAPLAELVRTENPDMIFAQEVTPEWGEALGKLTDRYPYSKIAPGIIGSGIAVLSRLPFDKIGDSEVPPYNGPAWNIEVKIGGAPVRIATLHTLPGVGREGFRDRNEQLRILADEVRRMPSPKIVIGDLNITMFAPRFKGLLDDTGLYNAREGYGTLPSWPVWPSLPNLSKFISVPIDHCLLSRDIRVRNIRLGPDIDSDHYPLIVDIEIPQPR